MLSRNSNRALVAAAAILFSAALSDNALRAFTPGDVFTYTQAYWSDDPIAVGLLHNNYDSVYESSFSLVELGIPGPAGHSMFFSSASRVVDYLPASGTPAPLNLDLLNPTSTSSGAFAGEVLALRLNIDFSDAGVMLGALGVPFGNLQLRNFPVNSNLNDLTVRQIFGHANNLLGGGSSLFYSISELNEVALQLNASFIAGGVSIFAQDHLRVIPISGDYNGNGTVDAADYVLWRNGGPLQNDATPGVQPADYDVWTANFGRPSGSGATLAVVPEPATPGLALVGLFVLACRRRRSVVITLRVMNSLTRSVRATLSGRNPC